MFKKFIPFAHATNIYEIPVEFYKSLGIKTLLMDLDNTLDSYRLMKPKQAAIDLIAKLRENGITPVIISNNKGKRVTSYATALGVDYIWGARKPFAKNILKFINSHDIDKSATILVGDQLITDVWCGYHAGLRVIWTNKLVKEDQWTTHINRVFERIIKRYHYKHGNIRDWRDIYGESKKS